MVFFKKGLNIVAEYYIQKCILSFLCYFHPHISIYTEGYTCIIYRELQICHNDTFLHLHLHAQSNVLRDHQNLQLKFHLFYQKGKDFLSFSQTHWTHLLPNRLCFMFSIPEYSRKMPAGFQMPALKGLCSAKLTSLYAVQPWGI